MNRKILLGDEDPPVRIMVARVLRAGGYDVVSVGTARDAMVEFERARPDVVVLDVKGPGAEGWGAFADIRRLNPAVPMIATTTWSDQYEQAALRGIDALMEKPLDMPLLLAVINELLGETEAVRTERRNAGTSLESARVAA